MRTFFIELEQKTTNKNPRSTVGTTTEIYDYLRLLYARAGTAYSYQSGEEMMKYTEEQVIDMTMRLLGIRQKIKPDDAADGLAMAIYAIYSSHSMSLKREVQL